MATDRARIQSVMDMVNSSRCAGNAELLADLFTEDGTFRISSSSPDWPAGQTAKGKAAIRQTLAGLIEVFEFLEYKYISKVIDGDEAVGVSQIKVRHVPSGKIRDFESADCVSFRDGKIARFVQFVDTASVIELMSPT